MAKLELTIDRNYLPRWGVWEGIRELIQNGRDAEIEAKGKLTVQWACTGGDAGKLQIENTGCVLTREALLLGRTTKGGGRSDMIGQFGEGMKLGILALVRRGVGVIIRSGDEVWKPSIERSEKFCAEVLTFTITGGREYKHRVCVEVECTRQDWFSLEARFLFLHKQIEAIATPHGDLLLSSFHRGKVYVKGIFVKDDGEMDFGYNFAHAQLDRDRRMLDSYDEANERSRIWREAIARRPDLLDDFYAMLQDQRSDVSNLQFGAEYSTSPEMREQIAARFRAQHPDAVPCGTLAESQELEHLGRRGVVCPPAMLAVLRTVFGSVDDVKAKLKDEVLKVYSASDLTLDEHDNLYRAVCLVAKTVNLTYEDLLARVDVVAFRSEDLMGQHRPATGRSLVARRVVSDRAACLETLVHEVAHVRGGDGEKNHVAEIERIWSAIVEQMSS